MKTRLLHSTRTKGLDAFANMLVLGRVPICLRFTNVKLVRMKPFNRIKTKSISKLNKDSLHLNILIPI